MVIFFVITVRLHGNYTKEIWYEYCETNYISLGFYYMIFSCLCPSSKKEKVMSHVLYASRSVKYAIV